MNRFHTAPVILAATLASTGAPIFAQDAPVPSRPRTAPAAPLPNPTQPGQSPIVVYQNPADARDVQQQLRQILQAYPPSLQQLIRLDPSLMQREDFMAPYPALTAFLQQHPEIVRNPGFYFGEPFFERERTDRERTLDLVRQTMDGIAFLAGFLVVVTLVYSLLRQALEHRRWRRHIQIQTEMHTKVLDRMTNNQELLAYMETAAGRRFLDAPGPVAAMQAPALSMAPVARILWSVQIGIIVTATGFGFWNVRASVADTDVMAVFQVMGTLAVAVGLGFVLSALVSWLLSQRMGLVQSVPAKVE